MLRYTVLAGLAGCIGAFPVAPFLPVSTDVTPDELVHSRRTRAICDEIGCQWPDALVVWEFQSAGWPAEQVQPVQDTLARAIAEFQRRTVVRFIERQEYARSNMRNNNQREPEMVLEITWGSASSCASITGGVSGEVSYRALEFGGCWNQYPAYIHELGHAIGLHHEQQRFDRDDYIVVGATSSADPSNWEIETGRNPVPYDFASIMHYSLGPGDDYTDDGRALHVSQGSPVLGAAATLSVGDVLTINTMYAAATVELNRVTDLTIRVGDVLAGNTDLLTGGFHFFGNENPEVFYRFIVPANGGKYQFAACGSPVGGSQGATTVTLQVYNADWEPVDLLEDQPTETCPGSVRVHIPYSRTLGTRQYWVAVEGPGGQAHPYFLSMAGGETMSGPVFQPDDLIYSTRMNNLDGEMCAPEGGTCTCDGIMRYGDSTNSVVTAKRTTGPTPCSAEFFGLDYFPDREGFDPHMFCSCHADVVRTSVTTGAGTFDDQEGRLEYALEGSPEHAYMMWIPNDDSLGQHTLSTATYEFSTCDSEGFDSSLRILVAAPSQKVWDGPNWEHNAGLGVGTELASSSGGCRGPNRGAYLRVRLQPGRYWIVVHGRRGPYDRMHGHYTLKSNFAPTIVESVNGECSVSEHPGGTSNRRGGETTCPEGYDRTLQTGACIDNNVPKCIRVVADPNPTPILL